MKAILVPEYGSPDVLQFTDVEKPVPNEDQVLVKIVAAAANLDWHGMRGEPFLVRMSGEFRRPKDLRWARISPGGWKRWVKTSRSSSPAMKSSEL